ncbi:MAG TPA: CPBP family intramembrane glutamic endopeptidase [Candidatus Dormibacteraeota bacterium]|nr:CPBP family intramembrane glutamic endopeptidase [Candidatus Dormibacteraeota bacterium]
MEHFTAELFVAGSALAQDWFLLLPLPVVLLANWHERHRSHPFQGLGAAVADMIWPVLVLIAVAAVFLGLLLGSLLYTANPAHAGPGPWLFAAVMAATGVAAGAVSHRGIRERLSNLLPIDPDSALDATALVLVLVTIGYQLANQLAVDVLARQASLQPLGVEDMIAQELPFLLTAFFGVGFLIRRPPRLTLRRLGWVRPSPWQVLLALAAAGLFYAFGSGADRLTHLLTPVTAHRLDIVNQRLFGGLHGPGGIAVLALSAGICEETLFRGAIQPRLGLLVAALVFAALHTEYGLTIDEVAVFVLALGLGAVRRLTNTTGSIICHVVYDTLVAVGMSGVWLAVALVTEAGLILVSLAAYLSGRLPPGDPAAAVGRSEQV